MAADRPRFCPWCGEPVGSFFGRVDTRGATWCERCEEWFAARRADGPGTDGEDRSFPDNDGDA